jgi:hypothetical protein
VKLTGLGLNLFQNPSFEFSSLNWSFPSPQGELVTSPVFDGRYSLKLSSTIVVGAYERGYYAGPRNYYLRFFVYRESGTVRINTAYYEKEDVKIIEFLDPWQTPTAGTWVEIERAYSPDDFPDGAKYLRVGVEVENGTSYFDCFYFTGERREYSFSDYPVYPYFRKTTNSVKRFRTQDGRMLTLQQGVGKDRYELSFTAISQAQFIEFRRLFEDYQIFEFEPGLEGEKNWTLVYWTGTDFRMNEIAGGPYYTGQVILEEI